jgi:hypothetical protein
MPVSLICPVDGVHFTLPPSHAKRIAEPTCSCRCAGILRKKRMGHISVIMTCDFCGQPFSCSASVANRARHHFCCLAHRVADKTHYVHPVEPRFWSKVNKATCLGESCGCHQGLGHCWPWKGSLDGDGYGMFHYQGKPIKASRMAYALTAGVNVLDIPSQHYRCHKCDQPICVRPDHTFTGTAQDNFDDAVQKGRQRRIAPEAVEQIRAMHTMTMKARAEMFQVSPTLVWLIVHNRIHVK